MRLLTLPPACALLFAGTSVAVSNLTTPLSSHQILPSNFKPPQVFQNVNLMRNVNLEKGYVRETVNVVIENIDSKPQDEYFIPFEAEVIGNVGGLEARDKKDPEKPSFRSEVVEYDTYRYFCALNAFETDTLLIHNLAPPNSTASPSPHPLRPNLSSPSRYLTTSSPPLCLSPRR